MNKYSAFVNKLVNLSTLFVRVLRFSACRYYYVLNRSYYSPFLFSALCFTRTRIAKAIATAAIATDVYTIAELYVLLMFIACSGEPGQWA